MSAITLNLPSMLKLSDEQFEQLTVANRDVRLELTAQGELVIMPPTGGETGNRNVEIVIDLGIWNRQSRLGKVFDSSTGFRLPNGALRSPDASWIEQERWEALTPQQRKKFLPLCPDFAVELVSESDRLNEIGQKMQEYIDNGLRLGWLIAPQTRTVEIYRPLKEVEVVNTASLSGEDVLPGFVFDLQALWD